MRGLLVVLVALVLLCGLPQAEAKNRNKSKLVRPMLAPTRICRHAGLRERGLRPVVPPGAAARLLPLPCIRGAARRLEDAA